MDAILLAILAHAEDARVGEGGAGRGRSAAAWRAAAGRDGAGLRDVLPALRADSGWRPANGRGAGAVFCELERRSAEAERIGFCAGVGVFQAEVSGMSGGGLLSDISDQRSGSKQGRETGTTGELAQKAQRIKRSRIRETQEHSQE